MGFWGWCGLQEKGGQQMETGGCGQATKAALPHAGPRELVRRLQPEAEAGLGCHMCAVTAACRVGDCGSWVNQWWGLRERAGSGTVRAAALIWRQDLSLSLPPPCHSLSLVPRLCLNRWTDGQRECAEALAGSVGDPPSVLTPPARTPCFTPSHPPHDFQRQLHHYCLQSIAWETKARESDRPAHGPCEPQGQSQWPLPLSLVLS